ncbi:cysteine-rich motor neuron 1 protein-like [Mytilus edulis]|uniref:cysteine-rich motor neuron 1 protein-like n=1 Tax=Mytilus edulis TaxID=6550 RepID=UPI0039F04918
MTFESGGGGSGGAQGSPFGSGGDGGSDGAQGSPFNQGNDLSRTPFTSSIDALDSRVGGGMGEVSGIGMGGMRNGLMSVPGMFLHGPSSSKGRVACLRDDIICPSYCLVIDESGCKSCPCGPASGMGVAMISHSHGKTKPTQQPNNQCVATLLCMLSCDDGYKLGPKGKDGCQTCECTKHKSKQEENSKGNGDKEEKGSNKDKNLNGTGSKSSGSGSGFNPMFAGSGGSGMGGGGKSNSGCSGPFCAMMSTTGGKSMTGPFTGSGQDGGNGDKCTGPSCSAPGNHNPGTVGKISEQSACPTTDLCAKTCKYTVKLGSKMADGCPSCACEKTQLTTKATPKQILCVEVVKCIMSCTEGYKLQSGKEGGCPICSCQQPPTPAPTVAATKNILSCTERTIHCMKSCKHGYHMLSSLNSDCPRCNCLPPPTSAPTPTPGIYSVLRQCPETVHCMTSCSKGYSLEGGSSGCPKCSCNQAQVITLMCTAALSCPRGCQLGYKCGNDGCPTCSCVEAKEIGVTHTDTYIQSSLTCSVQLSCVSKCPFGYKTGENGCPTCRCLQHISAYHLLTEKHHLAVADRCPEATRCSEMCPEGYTLKTLVGRECPVCQCVRIITESIHNQVGSCTGPECSSGPVHHSSLKERCPDTFRCNEICEHGFSLRTVVGQECPVCQCAVVTDKITMAKSQSESSQGKNVMSGNESSHNTIVSGNMGTHSSGGSTIMNGPSGSISFHESLTGHVPLAGHFNGGTLHQSPSHNLPLAGDLTDRNCIGPTCSAKNGMPTGRKAHIQPSQCAEILTCVVSCKHGYKLGPKGTDGCPSCTCLK